MMTVLSFFYNKANISIAWDMYNNPDFKCVSYICYTAWQFFVKDLHEFCKVLWKNRSR